MTRLDGSNLIQLTYGRRSSGCTTIPRAAGTGSGKRDQSFGRHWCQRTSRFASWIHGAARAPGMDV